MGHEIRYAESLSDAERRELFGWGSDIFGVESLSLDWRRKDWHVLLSADGQLVSHVGVVKESISAKADDEVLRVAGIGGVVTVPACRSRGYARETINAAVAFAKSESGADFAMLFCREMLVEFYSKLGWSRVTDRVEILQSTANVESPLPAMVLSLSWQTWPQGTVSIDSLPW